MFERRYQEFLESKGVPPVSDGVEKASSEDSGFPDFPSQNLVSDQHLSSEEEIGFSGASGSKGQFPKQFSGDTRAVPFAPSLESSAISSSQAYPSSSPGPAELGSTLGPSSVPIAPNPKVATSPQGLVQVPKVPALKVPVPEVPKAIPEKARPVAPAKIGHQQGDC